MLGWASVCAAGATCSAEYRSSGPPLPPTLGTESIRTGFLLITAMHTAPIARLRPAWRTHPANGAFDPRSLAGSASCGQSGCHTEIYKEWQSSAHRYAAMDPIFQGIQNVMAKQNGPESTRYCGGCHRSDFALLGDEEHLRLEPDRHARIQRGHLLSCLPFDPEDRHPGQRELHSLAAQGVSMAMERRSHPGRYGAQLPDTLVARASTTA